MRTAGEKILQRENHVIEWLREIHKYKVTRIGENVNDTIRESGHCTLLFNAKGSMPGQIELEGGSVPPLSQGQKFAFAGK